MKGLMAVAAGVFLALCIKSFIDARRRRRQGEGQAQGTGAVQSGPGVSG
jgi:hypothetical protein